MRRAALVAALASCSALVWADRQARPPTVSPSRPGSAPVAEEVRELERQVERGEQLVERAVGERQTEARFRLADEGQALCRKAAERRPGDARAVACAARALTVASVEHPEQCRPGACERAAAELRRARAIAGDGPILSTLAGDLGLVLSRMGAFADALAEYDRALLLVKPDRLADALEQIPDDGGRALLLGNSAETLMALGRLDEAIARYQLSAALSHAGSVSYRLAQWGLGVAYDRDEQVERSREAVRRALESDPMLTQLSDEGVFFEPPGDKRYYEALGHEVAGDLAQAAEGWRAFLAERPTSRFARRARAHLAAISDEALRGDRADAARLDLSLSLSRMVGARPEAALWEGVRAREPELKLCFARAIRSDPALARRATSLILRLDIAPQGYVTHDVKVLKGAEALPKGLERCLLSTVGNWWFGPLDGGDPEGLMLSIEARPAGRRG
jgi:tetratricopeptide (TPR) repeat protein